MRRLALACLFVLGLASPGWAAIAVDNSTAGGTTSGTFAHTVNSNTDGLLTVCAGTHVAAGVVVSGVTYNGVAMTKAIELADPTFTNVLSSLWYLKMPATGTNNVVITFSGTVNRFGVGAVSFTGVDQTTPISNATSASNTAGDSTINVTSSIGSVVVDCLSVGSGGTPTAGQTLRWSQIEGVFGDDSGQQTAAGAASVTMTWDWTAAAALYCTTAMSVNAASTASAPVRRRVIQ